jgi:hypothetical protein
MASFIPPNFLGVVKHHILGKKILGSIRYVRELLISFVDEGCFT